MRKVLCTGPLAVAVATLTAGCLDLDIKFGCDANPGPPYNSSPSWSPEGKRIAFARRLGDDAGIYIMDGDGDNARQLTNGRHDTEPAWSPDGRTIAFVRGTDGGPIFVVDVDGGRLRRVTRNAGDGSPAWSPDGSKLAFTRRGGGATSILTVRRSGRNPKLVVADGYDPAWSPDGRRLAFARGLVYTSNADGMHERRISAPESYEGASDKSPTWSPDGRTIAFVRYSGSWGNDSVYLVDSDGGGQRTLLSGDCRYGDEPAWSPDGKHIAFASTPNGNDPQISVVDADGSDVRRLTG